MGINGRPRGRQPPRERHGISHRRRRRRDVHGPDLPRRRDRGQVRRQGAVEPARGRRGGPRCGRRRGRRGRARRAGTSSTARPSGSTRCSSARAPASGSLTTEGFRDVLEVRRLMRVDEHGEHLGSTSSDPGAARRAVAARLAVEERILADGSVRTRSTPDGVRAAGRRCSRAKASSASRSSLLNAHANPAHELRGGAGSCARPASGAPSRSRIRSPVSTASTSEPRRP